MRDGYSSEIRIYRPVKAPNSSPLVVLLFGGGFHIGTNQQLTPFARAIAVLYGATVVTLSYRLAPEHTFPASQHDCWDSLVWLAKNASSIGADPSAGFCLGGVSAGGAITACLAEKSVNEKLSPPLTGIWLCVPSTCWPNPPAGYEDVYLSREQSKNAPILNSGDVETLLASLKVDSKSPLCSPFNASDPHRGMPRTYLQVDGLDPLRDDALIYDRILKEHGVETRLDVYPGLPHAHFAFVPTLESSRKAVADIMRGFGWLLKKEVSDDEITKVLAPPAPAELRDVVSELEKVAV